MNGNLRRVLPLSPSHCTATCIRLFICGVTCPRLKCLCAPRGSAACTIPTLINSLMHERRISYLANSDGGPMNCLISARSTKARSMASVMLDVVIINTLGFSRSLSICVSSAFTERIASDGSEPAMAAFRAAVRLSTSSMRTQTKESSSSTCSPIFANSF